MICACILPFYDPEACKNCLAQVRELNYGYGYTTTSPIEVWKDPVIGPKNEEKVKFPRRIVIKTNKITEVFDDNGNLLERTVEIIEENE